MHAWDLLESLKLTCIEFVRISIDEAKHVCVAILIKLFLWCLDLSKSSHWVKDDIVGGVKLTFLDRQKFADDRRQTVEVIAVQSLLLTEELHLI